MDSESGEDEELALEPLLDESSQSCPEPELESAATCYCGGPREPLEPDFLCFRCRKWFHRKCVQLELPRALFQNNYTFVCATCTGGRESFARRQTNFSQMCETALANLTARAAGERVAFSGREVIHVLDELWDHVTTMPRRVKQTWHATVLKTMQKESETFVCDPTDQLDPLFALRNRDLSRLAPNYEQTRAGKRVRGPNAQEPQEQLQKRQRSELATPRLPPSGFPQEFPFNKDGYRYVLAEADPHGPFRREFEESQDLAGKPIPGWLCRKLMPERALLSLHDRAPQLKISEDRRSVTGEKGYCMVRANVGASRGNWFFEVRVDELPEGAAVRVGWAQELANLQAPLGYDRFGYSVRSRKGTCFHESRGRHFGPPFGKGDVIGLLVELPDARPRLPATHKERPLVKFKSFLYFETKDDPTAAQKLHKLTGSRLTVFKNGRRIGTAFEGLLAGHYFPAASLYKAAQLTFNFGPDFAFGADRECRAVSELVLEETVAQALSEALYLVENEGRLRLDTFYGQ